MRKILIHILCHTCRFFGKGSVKLTDIRLSSSNSNAITFKKKQKIRSSVFNFLSVENEHDMQSKTWSIFIEQFFY